MTNFNSNLNNLLKNLSTNLQKKPQNKAIEKKEQKQENLFNLSNVNVNKNKLDNNDLYGGMVSISKKDTLSDNVKEKTQKSVNTSNLNNLLKNLKTETKASLNTPEVKSEQKTPQISKNVQNQNSATTLNTSNLSNLLKNSKINLTNATLKSASMLSATPTVQTVKETPKVAETPTVPVAEKSVSQIQAENLEKTISSIEKYVARIDLSLMDYYNPQSDFNAGYYDFTDYTAEYDGQNRVTKLSSKYNTGATIGITYDENNNAKVNVEVSDYPKTFTLNSDGKITSFGHGDKKEYSYEYDNDGKLIKTVSHQYVDVNYTDYTYDEHGNMVTNGAGGKYINTYDNAGHLMSVTYDNKTLEYDVNGNIVKAPSRFNSTITYEYDLNNNFVKAFDEKGNEYDKHGNVIKYSSVENGATFVRETKVAENGQKIIVNKLSDEKGVSMEFITDSNGFDMSQTITLSDGKTIENTFDSKSQNWANYGVLFDRIGVLKKYGKTYGIFGPRVQLTITSQTVKNFDGTTVYTLENSSKVPISNFLLCDTETNTTALKNLSFNNGEKVLVNEDMSLNVTKTDGAIDIYDYNTKTRNFEFRKTFSPDTPPADLTYDFNKDGKVDYKDFFDFYKDSKYDRDTLIGITNEVLKNIPENINMNYLSEFYSNLDSIGHYNKDYLYILNNSYTESFYRIYEKLLDKIYGNKEKNFDFTKDGKIDVEDVKLLVNAFNGKNSEYSYENIPGIDFNGDGVVSDIEKRTLFGESNVYIKDVIVERHIKNAFLEILRQDKENLTNIKTELEAELEKLPEYSDNWARELLQDFIYMLDDDRYYEYESFYIRPEDRYDGYDKRWGNYM